jgi:hypothetical protein
MRIDRLLVGIVCAGCASVAPASSSSDGGVGSDAAGTDGAGPSGDAGASEAGTVTDSAAGPVTCATPLAAACCSAGASVCVADWNDQISCSASYGKPEAQCDGFQAVEIGVDTITHLLFSVATGEIVALVDCLSETSCWCSAGPAVLAIDAGCFTYWNTLASNTTIPCFDAGDAAQEMFPCDGGLPQPDDAQSDAPGN